MHGEPTKAPGRQWNERNGGIGLESRMRGVPWRDQIAGDPWQTNYSVGGFTDSRNKRSFYAGAAVMHELFRFEGVRVDAGAGAFLFYKSVSWKGDMALMPGILPVLTYTDRNAPYGFNMIWRPPESGGRGTLFMQITQRFK